MYNLTHNPILTPYQVTILRRFFSDPVSRTFFLTGGTALAAFYFAHRESKDLDLFSRDEFSMMHMETLLRSIADALGAVFEVKVSTNTYKEVYVRNEKDEWVQRIDIVRDQPRHFGEIQEVDGVRVDALENIGSNKVLTLYSRLEPKDYVDFYTIVTQSPWTFEQLFALAKQKDMGLYEFYFANCIADVEKIESWPELKIDFDIPMMITYYQKLSRDLFLRVKPKE